MGKVFKLFCFLAIVGLMSSCEDDPEAWTQLPKDEISADSDNLTMSVNGQASTKGKVKLTAKSATEGVVTLTDVVPGYATVPVDVALVEQTDGSFNYNGTTQITTAPSRAEATGSDECFMTVNVSGKVSLDGKMTANVTAKGAAFYIGVYSNDSLALTYCDVPMVGKTVAYASVSDKPSLVITGVIPGDFVTTIEGVYPDDSGSFNGTSTTANGTEVKYSGKFNAGTGVLSLNVVPTLGTQAQGGIAKTWNLSHQAESDAENNYAFNPYPPLRMIWSAIDEDEMNAQQIALLASRAGGHFLVDLLNNITLNPNGTLSASYGDAKNIVIPDMNDMMAMIAWFFGLLEPNMEPTNTTWIQSPSNLAYWYTRDGMFYFVPDIAQIILQANKDNGTSEVSPEMILGIISSIAEMSDEELKALFESLGSMLEMPGLDLSDVDPAIVRTILSWIETGVPLHYTVDGEYLSLYIDKAMAEPYMTLIFKFLPILQAKMDEMAATNPMMSMMWGVLGIEKLSDLETIWNENTADFKIAISFDQSSRAGKSHRAAKKNYVQKFDSVDEAMAKIKAMITKK